MPLTCDIGRQERDQILEAFRQGHLRTVVSSRVLNEGLDVPDADVAVIVGGALGEREHYSGSAGSSGRHPGSGRSCTSWSLPDSDERCLVIVTVYEATR